MRPSARHAFGDESGNITGLTAHAPNETYTPSACQRSFLEQLRIASRAVRYRVLVVEHVANRPYFFVGVGCFFFRHGTQKVMVHERIATATSV